MEVMQLMASWARIKLKRRACWLGAFLIAFFAIAALVAFTRLHFSHQNFPRLSQLQWSGSSHYESKAVKPLIIGHRGSGLKASGSVVASDEPLLIGNTENAIRRGIAAKADWIEIDVRESKDGFLVVFHDEQIGPPKTSGHGSVAELTLAELQAQQVCVTPPERILALEDVFNRFGSDQCKWVLDVKTTNIADQLLATVGGIAPQENVILFGDDAVLREYKDSGYALGLTVLGEDYRNWLRVLFQPSAIVERGEDLGCSYLVLPIMFATQALVDAASSKGIEIWTYGAEDVQDLDYSAQRGIGGLIVDHPRNAIAHFHDWPP
jgi:glycerophosphoryl diester phosphodiesterase